MNKMLLPAGRVLWLGIFLTIFGMWAAGLTVLVSDPVKDCTAVPCDPSDFNAGDIEVMRSMGVSWADEGWWFVVVLYNLPIGILYFTSGLVVFWRKSEDWMGLLVSISMVFLGGILFTSTDDAFVRAYPGLIFLREIIVPLGMGLFIVLFFVFPDGRIRPAWLWWPSVALISVYVLVELLTPGSNSVNPIWLVTLFPIMIFAQVYRYLRLSTRAERQQTKWVVVGLLAALALMVTWTMLANFYPPGYPAPARIYALMVALPVLTVCALTLPLTFAFSILRYRLWDIDFLIRRTLGYAILTGLLGLVYYGIVVGLQDVFVGLTGQSSQVVLVVSTLLIAALFNPLRSRIQELIDRSFYRQKYDMEQTVEAFALAVRDEVDVDRLNTALLQIVEETMRPEGASLWLQEPGDAQRRLRG